MGLMAVIGRATIQEGGSLNGGEHIRAKVARALWTEQWCDGEQN